MTTSFALIGLALVLVDDDLLRKTLFLDFADDSGTLDIRIADDCLLTADEKNLFESHVFAGFGVEFLDVDLVSNGDFDLFAAGFYDGVLG